MGLVGSEMCIRDRKDIDQWQPDVVVLVDFSGFNMKVAKYAKKQGYKVFYYISPKIWAWNRRRAYTIKKLIDRMFVILPFETDFYKRYGYDVDYVGNPVNDAVAAFVPDADFRKKYSLKDLPILTIMPGSRKQEVQKMLPKMLEVASEFNKDFQLVVATVDTLPEAVYKPIINKYPGVKVILDDTYNLLSYSHTAIVKSGTSTLETGLFRVPQVVCYKMGWLNYILAELIVKVKYISLVNIIAGKEVVKELLQLKFTKAKLQKELKALLYDEQHRQAILDGYTEIQTTLGEPGTATKTAKLMVGYLKK